MFDFCWQWTVFLQYDGLISDQVRVDMAIYLVKSGITPVVAMNKIDAYCGRDRFLRCEKVFRNCLIKKYPGQYEDWQFQKAYTQQSCVAGFVKKIW